MSSRKPIFSSKTQVETRPFLFQNNTCNREGIYCKIYIQAHCSLSVKIAEFVIDGMTENTFDPCSKYVEKPREQRYQEIGWKKGVDFFTLL